MNNLTGTEHDGTLDMLALVEASWRADGTQQKLLGTYPPEMRQWIYGATGVARLALQMAENHGADVAAQIDHLRTNALKDRDR